MGFDVGEHTERVDDEPHAHAGDRPCHDLASGGRMLCHVLRQAEDAAADHRRHHKREQADEPHCAARPRGRRTGTLHHRRRIGCVLPAVRHRQSTPVVCMHADIRA